MALIAHRRRGFAAGVVAAGLAVFAAYAAAPAVHAQIMGSLPTIRTYVLGPVLVNPGETLHFEYSNALSPTSAAIGAGFLNAQTGTLLETHSGVIAPHGEFALDLEYSKPVAVTAIVVVAALRFGPAPTLTVIKTPAAAAPNW